jgi:hypothetical protein
MKTKKHPSKMTSDELMKHLFRPKVVKHIKKVANPRKPVSMKKV